MPEKKRKHHEGQEDRPRKKAATDKPSGVLKVNWLQGSKELTPVIISSPGLSLPSDLEFEPYAKQDGQKQELLLHSSTHPSIDFIVQEEDDNSETKHYIAVYDPSTKSLKLTEAKNLTARASVRQLPPDSDADSSSSEMEKTSVAPNSSTRATLIEAFGNKKQKKAYAAAMDNTLISRSDTSTKTPISSALLSSLPTSQLSEPAVSTGQLIQENKPLPHRNLNAESITDVYPLKSLVHPSPSLRTLSSLPTDSWLSSAKAKKPITAPSKYVANRISAIAFTAATSSDPDTSKNAKTYLRILRYILLLLNLHRLATSGANGHNLPYDIKRWTPGIAGPGTVPFSVLEGLRRQYIPEGAKMRNYDLNLLRATICALTLHIPPPKEVTRDAGELVTHPGDIREDMALDANAIRKLYRELGCRMEKLDDGGLKRWGVKIHSSSKVKDEEKSDGEEGTKAKAKAKRKQNQDREVAKLKLPLQFPGLSKGKAR